MLHPKCLVMTTPEVIRGAPILVVDYSTESQGESDGFAGTGGGQFSGWTFSHVQGLPDDAGLYFFEQIPHLDPAIDAIMQDAAPGAYLRETEFAPFEFEPPDEE